MITPEQATAEVVAVLNSVCLSTVSAAGEQWLVNWWRGATHADESRAVILESEDGEAELAGLLEELKSVGSFLNGCCLYADLQSAGDGEEVGPAELQALAFYMAEKKRSLGKLTRLCDGVGG